MEFTETEPKTSGSSASVELDEEKIMLDLAASGSFDASLEWSDVKVMLKDRMNRVLETLFETKGFAGAITQTFESRISELSTSLDKLQAPPFTLQRFTEILVLQEHRDQYKSTHKLMNALQKLLYVTS